MPLLQYIQYSRDQRMCDILCSNVAASVERDIIKKKNTLQATSHFTLKGTELQQRYYEEKKKLAT